MADHLSRLHIPSTGDISVSFLNKHLISISSHDNLFAHIVNFLVTGLILEHWNRHQKDKFFHELKYYFWEELFLLHLRYDQIIRECIPEEEQRNILVMCHLISPKYGCNASLCFYSKLINKNIYIRISLQICNYPKMWLSKGVESKGGCNNDFFFSNSRQNSFPRSRIVSNKIIV